MIRFIVGFVSGIIVATVGFTGIATLADNSLDTAKVVIQQQAQPKTK